MGNEVEDPIANYSGLSLFRSTFSLSKPFHDLDAIHINLRSMDLQDPAKLVEQGKSILESNLELNTENLTQDEENDDVFAVEEGEELPRKRRPGLGLNRERPRFSLKPTKKPSLEDLLPILDIKNHKDPEEFFLAHERRENARKEIQKQLGIVSSEQNQDLTKPRNRRPGLPGFNRRPVKYRHRFSQETLDYNGDVLSSQEQEAFEFDSLDPVGDNTEEGEASPASLNNEVTDSSPVEVNKVNDILQGLLTCDSEELEGDGAVNLLQERLQIKPIIFEKISVPDFPDIQPLDLKSLQGNLSKPRKALSDIGNLMKGIDIKTPLRRDVECAEKQLASPTPPRSPFALFSTMQRQISRSKPSVDPFSDHTDHISTRNYSPTPAINQEVNIVSSSKPSDELSAPVIEDVAAGGTNKILGTSEKSKEDNSRKSSEQVDAPLIEDKIAVSETSLDDNPVRNSISTPQKSMGDSLRKPEFNANVDSNEPSIDMDVDVGVSETSLIKDKVAVSETSLDDDTVRNSISTPQKSMGDSLREPEFNANVDSNEPPVDMDVDIGGSGMGKRVMDDTVGKQSVEPNEPQFQDNMLAENVQEFAASIPTDDANFNLVIPQADQSNPDAHQAKSLDKSSRRSDDGPEQCLQETAVVSVAPVAPVNQKTRVKSRAQKEPRNKRLQLRKSLADAGTSCESGVRRSSRFRTRPLEYWKGERMVYGRVHESLSTVIGVKRMSPGSNGKPSMKVKSFVSDKYKELFEMASLY